MIIDFHTHIGNDIKDDKFLKLNFSELKDSMNQWNIDKSVVFPINVGDDMLIEKSLGILKFSKENNWVIPFLRISPKRTSEKELNDLIEKGFKGLKLHPRSQNFVPDSEEYFWIYRLCNERRVPILFHSSVKEDISHPRRIMNIAEKFPELIIIMAHYFGGDSGLIKDVARHSNIYVDSSLHLGSLSRSLAINKHNFKNLLFASDAPYDSQGVALLKIKEAGLSKEDEEMILSGNALKILNLE